MPDWPPANYDYKPKLKENGLRAVEVEKWRIEPELDSENRKKVYQVSGYPGLFMDSHVKEVQSEQNVRPSGQDYLP